jgi:serine/threonine protein kinase
LAHEYHKEEEWISLFMPYYRDGDLEEYLLKNREMGFKERMKIFVDVLVGLKELHSRLIIHRDLKLRNIFVDGGKAVVGDVGIAAVMEGSAHSQVGTFPNQAPEVYSNENYDDKVDLWATGIIAYQLFNPIVTDNLPFPFQTESSLRSSTILRSGSNIYKNYLEFTSKLNAFDKSVPEDLAGLIARMLQSDPEKRISWV